MILDDLANAPLYFGLGSGVRSALDYLAQTDLSAVVAGRYAIDGDRVVAGIDDYDTKPESEGLWEAHRRHVDVQCVISGQERVGVTPLMALDASPYDEERDVLFGHGRGDFVTLTPGRFLILFPHDAHMSGRSVGEPTRVRKVVVKIRIEPGAIWTAPPRRAVP